MNKHITFRNIQPSDYPLLESIIRRTWHYDELSDGRTAGRLAKAYLMSCLCNQTFTNVAMCKNIPVGIIMAKNIAAHHCPLYMRWKQIKAIISLLMHKESRKVISIFRNVSHIDEELIKKNKLTYQGEVAFFALDQDYRGHGIGKVLFDHMLAYMKKEAISNIFLFTDTSCNYGFYEHMQMEKRCETTHTFSIEEQDAKMTFFLYDYTIHEN